MRLTRIDRDYDVQLLYTVQDKYIVIMTNCSISILKKKHPSTPGMHNVTNTGLKVQSLAGLGVMGNRRRPPEWCW